MPFIDNFQEKIWKDKYQYKDETYEGFCERISGTIFPLEKKKAAQLKESIMGFRTLFGGRINSNIGIDEKGLTLFNCFIEATVKNPDSLEGIFDAVAKYGLTLKSEGGVGFCANYLRPANTLIRKVGVTTPGAIKFLEIFDKVSEVITSGSVSKEDSYQGVPTKNSIRKGATMVTLSCCHPDIEEFITAKSVPNKLTKMNMSVLITDAFMYAVDNDLDWALWFPDIAHEKYDDEWDGDFEKWASKGYSTVIYKTVKAIYLWELLLKSSYLRNEPGLLFIDTIRKMDNLHYLDSSVNCCNPCQPEWASVLTKNGIKQFRDINVGTEIWSEDGWVEVTNKRSSGIKEVYKYRTNAGVFYGTKNHRVVSNGEKIEIKDAISIDTLEGVCNHTDYDTQVIMDGLVLGDGSVHKASNNLIYLCIGENDKDYFNSEIKNYITKHRASAFKEFAWEVNTNLLPEEIPLTYERKIPNRYLYGDTKIVRSFLRGLFSANGTVLCSKYTKAVRLKSSSSKIVEDIQIMLSSLGIRSYITTNKSTKVKHKNGIYKSKESYDINITKHTLLFEQSIGFIQKYKQKKLIEINNRVLSNREKISFEVTYTEHISTEEVFDITVDGNSHTYWTGGCNVSNCAEIPSNTGIIEHKGKTYELGDICNLGSLVLPYYYNMGTKVFNKKLFIQDIEIMIEALDNIIDISDYPLEMYEQAAKMKRKIGLGVAGVGSLFMMMGIKYGGEESVKVIEDIMDLFMNTAYQKSTMLAKEKGPFELYSEELLNDGYVKNNGTLTTQTIDLIRKYGLRHSAISAIAPNGTLSILAGNVSGGLEPVFSPEYTRWNRVEGKKVDFKYPKSHKGEWFETDYFKEELIADEVILMAIDGKYRIDKNQGLCIKQVIRDYGYNKSLDHGLTEHTSAMELDVQEHFNILKVITSKIDQSSSKTINLPNDVSFEDFKALYGKIHSHGIKGCTTYRAGTSVAVLEVKKKEKDKTIKAQQKEFLETFKEHENGTIIRDVVRLPEEYPSKGYVIRAEKKKFYIHVAFKDEQMTKPFAIFLNTNDQSPTLITNSAIDALTKAARKYRLGGKKLEEVETKFKYQKNSVKIVRMLGYLLRHNLPIIDIIRALDKVEDAHPGTFVFRIKKFLGQFITEPVDLGITCSECGGTDVILQEGCTLCRSCGSSKCS